LSAAGRPLEEESLEMVWGFFNLIIAYLLICRVGDFDVRATPDIISLGLGMLLAGLLLADRFGRFNGGNSPVKG
jgi:hypothetical protein